MGGPDGKIFWLEVRAYVLNESQIFSRPAQPYSVNNILSYDHLLLKILKLLFEPKYRARLHKIRRPRARNNYMKVSHNKNLSFISSHRTRNLQFIESTTHFLIFVSFPQKRNGIVFSSGVDYLHSGSNIQSEVGS